MNRHAERRVDDEDRRPAHRKIREGQEDLRSVDGEAVEERVGDEREEGEEQPAPPERTGRRVDADRRPGDDRGRQDEHREGMGIAEVPREGGDRVRERPENVEVREESAESSPDRRPPPDLAPEGRFPNGGAEGNLGNDVHGAQSARAGVGRPGGIRRRWAIRSGRPQASPDIRPVVVRQAGCRYDSLPHDDSRRIREESRRSAGCFAYPSSSPTAGRWETASSTAR